MDCNREENYKRKAIRDYNQMMFKAEERGVEEGRKEEKYNTVKNFIAFDMSSDNISQVTGLSVEEVEKMRK